MPQWLAVLTALIGFGVSSLAAIGQEGKDKAKSAAKAQAKPARDDSEKPKLGIGDPAPVLKVDKWLKGAEVKEFEAGKTYVVEFWATWCGPCIVSMPHLSELQAEYRDKGLTIIGLTSQDPNNSAQQVDAFMKDRGAKFDYTFAYCDTRAMSDAYMRAANQNGIPCSFVVDKSGKIAYIGHPLSLDDVLPKVIDGTWKGQEDVDALEAIDKELQGILTKAGEDPDNAVKELSAFEAKHPNKAKQLMFVVNKMMLLSQAKKFDDLVAMSREVVERAEAKKDASALRYVAQLLVMPANAEKKGRDIALKATELNLKLSGENDLAALVTAIQVYSVVGDQAKFEEYSNKALEAADDPRTKSALENIIKSLKEKKSEVPAAKIKKPADKS